MKEKETNELANWYSTYGFITAERILERLKIKLPQQLLIAAVRNNNNFYHQLLMVPTKIIFNGIILQQAQDYQVYAQKSMVNYLLSSEAAKSPEETGEMTREDLEEMQKQLVELNDNFHQEEFNHNKLIAESQQSLMKYTAEWQKKLLTSAKQVKSKLKAAGGEASEPQIIQAINTLLINENLKPGEELSFKSQNWLVLEQLLMQSLGAELKQSFVEQVAKLVEFTQQVMIFSQNFMERATEMGIILRRYRSDFYQLILRSNELMQLLPDYRIDPQKMQINLESLYFDSQIGEA